MRACPSSPDPFPRAIGTGSKATSAIRHWWRFLRIDWGSGSRRVLRLGKRPVDGARRAHGQHRRSRRLVDVEPAAEEGVDLGSVRVRVDALDVADHGARPIDERVGLLRPSGPRSCRRAAGRRTESSRTPCRACRPAGSAAPSGLRGRAPVARSGWVVVDAARRLRLEQPEEDAYVGRADQADVAHAREREVEDRRVADPSVG